MTPLPLTGGRRDTSERPAVAVYRHGRRLRAHSARLRGGPEAGGATLLVVGAVGMLLALTVAAASLLAVVSAASRARAAADLSALAGAAALEGEGRAPCPVVVEVVLRNGAIPRSCRVGADGTVLVAVTARVSLRVPGVPTAAVARSRAGPSP